MRMSALFGAKTPGFSKFMVCPHGQGGGVGWTSADIFRTSGEGDQFFAILCGRLLWTASYRFSNWALI